MNKHGKNSLFFFVSVLFLTTFPIFLFGSNNVYIVDQTNNIVSIWDYKNDVVERLEFPDDDMITRLEVSRNEKMIYYAAGTSIVAFNTKTKKEEARLDLSLFGINRISNIKINGPKKQLWISGQTYLVVIDLIQYELLKVFESHQIFQVIEFSKGNRKAYVSIYGHYDPISKGYIYGKTVEVYSTITLDHIKSIQVTGPDSFGIIGAITQGIGQSLIVNIRGGDERMLSKIDTIIDEATIMDIPTYTNWELCVDHKRRLVYGSNGGSGIISVHDLGTLEPIKEFQLPTNNEWTLESIEIENPYKYLIHTGIYSTDSGTSIQKVEIIDLDSYKVEKELILGNYPDIMWVFICVPNK